MIIISSGIGKENIKKIVCEIEGVKYIKKEGINQYFETPDDTIYLPLIQNALHSDITTNVLFYSFVLNEIDI